MTRSELLEIFAKEVQIRHVYECELQDAAEIMEKSCDHIARLTTERDELRGRIAIIESQLKKANKIIEDLRIANREFNINQVV